MLHEGKPCFPSFAGVWILEDRIVYPEVKQERYKCKILRQIGNMSQEKVSQEPIMVLLISNKLMVWVLALVLNSQC